MNRILIIAFNEKWVGISRLPYGLTQSGFETFALCPKDSYLAKTRYLKNAIHYPGIVYRFRLKLMYLWIIYSFFKFNPDLVIPGDEETIKALHRLANLTKSIPYFKKISILIRKSTSPENLDHITLNKSDFQKQCSEWGIRSPKNIIVKTINDALMAAKKIQYPLVLKHDVGAGGAGVVICQNEADLRKYFYQAPNFNFFKRMKYKIKQLIVISSTNQKEQISIQEFIEGPLGVTAFCSLNGKMLASNTMLTLKTNPEKTGPTCVAQGLNLPEMEDYVKIIAQKLHYTGFGGVDFIYQKDTNQAFIIEFNARPTPTCHLGEQAVANSLCQALFNGLNNIKITKNEFKNYFIAMFPAEKKRDPNSEYLTKGFHDMPIDDPELLAIFES